MADRRKSFSYIWKIKNFSFCFNSLLTSEPWLESPDFVVHEIDRTIWHLCLCHNNLVKGNCISIKLIRDGQSGSDIVHIDYELSFITSDESVILSKKFLNKSFRKNSELSLALTVKSEEIFEYKRHLFLAEETLTVRCRMWKIDGFISESVRCTVETRLNTTCKYLFGNIKKFSSLNLSSKNKVCIEEKAAESEIEPSSIDIYTGSNDNLCVEIRDLDNDPHTTYKIKIFILDIYGNKVKSCLQNFYKSDLCCIPMIFTKNDLMKYKKMFLHDNVLTLYFEFLSLTCKISEISSKLEITERMVYEYDYQGTEEAATTNMKDMNIFSEDTDSLTILKDDFSSLLREGVLSDIKLKTSTEIFPAHAVILSARSPVFKSMFTTDMREKIKGCVDIEDLDDDTVFQMLFFIYSGTLENLTYKRAKGLYFAADKYNIVSLRNMCSDFLKRNLRHSNCCDVLLLADKHQDKDLKSCVEDCIAENDDKVLSSDEWKNLMETQPRLTTDILLAVYMKNRKT